MLVRDAVLVFELVSSVLRQMHNLRHAAIKITIPICGLQCRHAINWVRVNKSGRRTGTACKGVLHWHGDDSRRKKTEALDAYYDTWYG